MKSLVKALIDLGNTTSKGITFINASGDEVFSPYKAFVDHAKCCLHNLLQQGVKAGDELVIQLDDNQSFLTVFWACLLGRIVPVPLAIGGYIDQKRKPLKVWPQLTSSWYVAEEGTLDKLLEVDSDDDLVKEQIKGKYIPISGILKKSKREELSLVPSGNDIAYIQYSSGSTGDPKGVILTHNNLCYNVEAILQRSGTTDSDSMLSWMPLTHDMGLICFHLSGVLSGIDQYIIPTKLFIRRPLLWIEKAAQHGITQLYSSNFGLQFFLSSFKRDADLNWDLSAVRILYNGAEQISEKICLQFIEALSVYGLKKDIIFPGYGLAEASVAVSLPNPGEPLKTHLLERDKLISGARVTFSKNDKKALPYMEVGYAVQDCEIRITHDDQVLEQEYLGTIEVKGKNVTRGYYGLDPKRLDQFTEDGWLKTGDLGFFINDRLVVTGRIKNLIVLNGLNYFPHDIEHILYSIPDIKEGYVAATSCWSNAIQREELLIFLILRNIKAQFLAFQEQIQEKLQEELGLVADHIIPIRKIPKTTSGKVQYFKLGQQFREGHYDKTLQNLPVNKSPSRGFDKQEIETTIAKWLPGISQDVPFHKAGLSSLQLVQFVADLRGKTGLRLSLSDLFENDTPEKLVAHLLKSAQHERNIPVLEKAANKPLYPVLPNQQKLWIIEQDEQRRGAFNVSFLLELGKLVDGQKMALAIEQLVDRHESLRTNFKQDGEELWQLVRPMSEVNVCFEQKTVDPSVFEEAQKQEANKVFDLESDALMRAILWSFPQQNKCLLQLTMHHIITDGWSIQQLLSDLSAFYLPEKPGGLSLAEPTLQLKDYIEWFGAIKGSSFYEKAQSYWVDTFKDGITSLRLPYNTTSKKRTLSADYAHISLNRELVVKIDAYAQSNNMSRFAVLLSFLHGTFYFHNRQESILTGVETANRGLPGTEAISGQLINTLLIQSQMSPGMTFQELTGQLHERLVQGLDFEYYSFEDLPQALTHNQIPYPFPLFNALVIYQNFTDILKPCEISSGQQPIMVRPDKALSDIVFEFSDAEDEVGLCIQYDTGLFTVGEVRSLSDHFLTLGEKWLAKPNDPFYTLEVHDSEGINKQLQLSKGRETIHPEKTVSGLLAASCAKYAKKDAIVCGGRKLTYHQLKDTIDQLSHTLVSEYEVKPSTHVAVVGKVNEKTIALMLAIWRLGAVYVPIDPTLPTERSDYILKDCSADLVIADSENIKGFKDVKTVSFEEVFSSPDKVSELPGHVEGPAYILYTSGTTGVPKGVVINQHSLADYVQTFISFFKITQDDVAVQQASIGFDTSFEEILPVLGAGGRLVIVPEGGRDVEALVDLMDKESVTLISTTPAIIQEINYIRPTLPHLRLMISGGDRLQENHISNLLGCGFDIYNSYGPTESTICATYGQVSMGAKQISIGKPIDNRQVFILNDGLRFAPLGEVGEICIGGKGLGYYLGLPELTKEKFIPNPYEPGEMLYRSGDLGRWVEDGAIEFLGRNDNQVKIRGFRIECGEIEQVICQQGVRQSVVVPGIDASGDSFLTAYVVGVDQEGLGSLKASLQKLLPFYMVPSVFVVLDEIPLNTNGKVNKEKLPKPSHTFDEVHFESLNTITEKKLAVIWQEILNTSHISADSNFIAEGGHSLKITRLISQVRRKFNVKLTIADVFGHQDLRSMAAFIDSLAPLNHQSIEAIPLQDYYPLSHGQKRLWTLDQLFPGNTAYNIVSSYHVKGDLKTGALDQAFYSIIDKYESLRTVFPMIKGEPRQLILPTSQESCKVSYQDWRHEENRYDKVVAYTSSEASFQFDLTTGPLTRFHIIRMENDEYRIILNIHHIISDGWSVELLLKEIVENLTSDKVGHGATLPIQYKDYTVWQEGSLRDTRGKGMKEFWQSKITLPIPNLSLPTDYKRPLSRTFKGGQSNFVMDQKVLRGVKALSSGLNTSNYTVLMASVFALLSKESNQSDLILGTYVAGRDHYDLEGQVGFFVNTVPYIAQIDNKGSFSTLVRQLHQYSIDIYPYREYPFDNIIEDLAITGEINRSVLFDVAVGYEDRSESLTHFPDLTIEPVTVVHGTSKFDLSFNFIEQGDLVLQIEYSTDLFKQASIDRFYSHLNKLLTDVIDYPDKALCEVSLITTHEREQLQSFNETEHNYSSVSTLNEIFTRQSAKYPEQTALVCGGRVYSYFLLNERSDQWAWLLTETYQLGRGDRVALFLDRSEDMLIAMLAVLKVGAAYVPIDIEFPKDRVNFIIDDVDPALVITDQNMALGKDRNFLFIRDIDRQTFRKEAFVSNNSSEDLCYILYTSGSTGTPKGVMVRHHSVVSLLNWLSAYMKVKPEDRLLSSTSYTFDISVVEYFLPWFSGASIILSTQQERKDISLLKGMLVKYKPTFFQSTPSLLSILVNSGWEGDRSLTIMTAGEPLSRSLASDLLARGSHVFNLYGPTEATIYATLYEVTKADNEPMYIGIPVGNTQIHILDKDQNQQPIGVVGELFISGSGVALGYHNRPELTSEKFLNDPYTTNQMCFRTGDYGRWTSDGVIEFFGRKDDQVKIMGYRIELGEIESMLRKSKMVGQSAVIVSEKENGDKQIIAYITLNQGYDGDMVREYLHDHLPVYMNPHVLIELETFPLTGSGKIDKKKLPAPDIIATKKHVEPKSELEKELSLIWKELLEVAQVGVHDNFLELGGHSLRAIRLSGLIASKLKKKINIRDIFLNPTLGKMAAYLENALPSDVQIEKAPLQESYPLSYNQYSLWIADQKSMEVPTYNIFGGYRLTGVINSKLFIRAFYLLWERHEILRTLFRMSPEGEMHQFISEVDKPGFIVKEYDWSDRPDRWEDVQTLLSEESAYRFDLSIDPLLKVTFIVMSPDEYALIINMHHIISDGWSIEVLVKEVQKNYTFLLKDEQYKPSPLAIQYKDYAHWQGAWLKSEDCLEQKNYWVNQFKEGITNLDLTKLSLNGSSGSLQAGRIDIELGKEEIESIDRLIKPLNVSKYVFFLSAWQLLLHKITNQNKIIVGTPVANRSHSVIDQIGYYVNTLLVNMDIEGSMKVSDVIQQCRDQVMAALRYQGYPFSLLVEALRELNVPVSQMVYNVGFSWFDYEEELWSMKDVTIELLDIPPVFPKTTLWLSGTMMNGSLKLTLVYDQSVISTATATILTRKYNQLIHAMIEGLAPTVVAIDITLEEEKTLEQSMDFMDIQFDF